MLAIIRDMLPSYPQLRLVLMSATFDAERFSDYFGGCPIIRVPGFTYPVKSFYLEDVLSILRSTENNHRKCTSDDVTMEDSILTEEYRVALDEAIDLALSNDEFDPLLDLISSEGGRKNFNYQHSITGVTPLMVFAGKGRVGDICMLLSFGADCRLQASDGNTALDWAEGFDHVEAAEIIKKHNEKTISHTEKETLLNKYLSSVDPELIDHVLIEQLLRRICAESKDGAILVFLPGWDDINKTRERLQSSPFFKDESKFVIISLHSMIPSVEQKKVFGLPPPGCRKIVLSTNIAETSVTIEDVVYVIDSGRMKEKSYDPYNNVSTLQSSWISKASAKQREGRAGRCQPGICYHLYSKDRSASLPDFQVPEIKRIPLEELCLQVKLLDPSCRIEHFLQKTLDPPVHETIHNGITVLQEIGALTLEENLTELGKRVGSLPVHPLKSKMLLIAILLNCLDPALTLACAADYRDPFTLPTQPDEKKRAIDAKSELASLSGGLSDQLAVIAAFEGWKIAKGKDEGSQFCSRYCISSSTMRMISRMRKQLETELRRSGFLPEAASNCSVNAQDPGILHAVLVAGLYPMVGRLLRPKNGMKPIVETSSGDKVRLHPRSTLFKLLFKKFSGQPLIMFDEITRGDRGLHIRKCSVVGPLPLLLLAMEIVVAPANEKDYEDTYVNDSNEDKIESHDKLIALREEKIMSSPDNAVKVIVDRWLPFESMALDVAHIYCLRERLSAAILYKVTHPRKVLPEHLGASLKAMSCILSKDGMSEISLPLEPVDLSSTMISAANIGQLNGTTKMELNENPEHHKSLTNNGKDENSVSIS
ncbi:D -box ATP-dependent RNA helicase D 6-like isoform X1 [Olea europaea subsp. europaea]|nr:D -box ATP-dependent RNA helicase D 6-like isoform X1 [Olea europaea subsp. europaea]